MQENGFQQASSCNCAAFRMQPFCTANRHMHAFIEEATGNVTIVDLTFNKRFEIKAVIDHKEQLLVKELLPPELTNCTVIGYHGDLAVIQIFFRDYVKIYVCDCTDFKCVCRYTVCPCFRRRLGLCEAYFTSNRQYLILKNSDGYNTLHRSCRLDHSFFEVVKMDAEIITSNHYTFSVNGEMVFIGLCPDPDSQTHIFTAMYRRGRIYSEWTKARLHPGLSTFDVQEQFEQRLNQQETCATESTLRLHTQFDYGTMSDKTRLINIQIPRNSNYVFMTFIKRQRLNRRFNTPKTVVHLLEKDDLRKIVRMWECGQVNESQSDVPKLTPAGSIIYIAGEKFRIPYRGLKSLPLLCIDVLKDTILPEDIKKLPLPTKLKNLILFGGDEVWTAPWRITWLSTSMYVDNFSACLCFESIL